VDLQDWDRFRDWNALFDALCRLRGYGENAALASAFCRQRGRAGARDFQAAEKNLRDWRLGRRIPLRRNAAILALLLDVQADPALKQRWDETYRALHGGRAVPEEDDPVAKSAPADHVLPSPRTAFLLLLALPAGLLAAGGMKGSAPPEGAAALPTVAYNARAFLSVGAEKLIHGVIEGCDGAPAQWASIAPRLPESRTGVLVDGGLATQMMNGCGREMVVRAVKFIALRPGVEELMVLDTYFKIEVTSPPAGLVEGDGYGEERGGYR